MGRKIMSCIMMTVMITCSIFGGSVYTPGADGKDIPSLILEYCDKVNTGDYIGLADLVDSADAEEYVKIFSNEANIRNNVGIMNVSNMEITDICPVGDFEEYERYYEKEEYTNPKYFILKTEMKVKEENEYFYKDGLNYIAAVIAEENGTEKIFETYLLDDAEGERYFAGPVGYAGAGDYSVACTGMYWQNPTYILVQISSTGEIKHVDFKEYCTIVSANEHGIATWKDDAHKACALAVKNYGWRMMLSPRKHSGKGYHVTDTTDQVYDPSVPQNKIDAVKSSVEAVWNYVMLDSEYKLMTSFYAANLTSNKGNHEDYAKQNGGVLSQNGARDLAKTGMSWQNILHYYYDTVSGKEKYGNILPNGAIKIVDLTHTASYGSSLYYDSRCHWKLCTICNLEHVSTKQAHNLRSTGGGHYECTQCRYSY